MEWKDNKYDLNKQIIFKDKLIDLSFPLVMGIINVTPDSFYAKSRNPSLDLVMETVENMVEQGVDILDIGGVSTRQNADLLTEKEELNRVIPAIQMIRKKYPEIPISVDTFRSNVARKAVENGANMVNDVYGGAYDKRMFSTISELDVPYILMHARGTAKDMQEKTNYQDVVQEVFYELSEKIAKARKLGVKDILIDLGFGFAKDVNQNYELLKNIAYFRLLDCPILVGISRKSMLYKMLEIEPIESLNGTTILNTFAMLSGAAVIRVHDVKEAKEVQKLISKLQK